MDPRVEKIYGFIKKNYQEKLLLEDLSAKVSLSPFYFQRLFKNEMKESPAGCINRIRLEMSCHLMRAGSNLNMAQIAVECGFSSAAAFTKAFKQMYGTTPVGFLKSDKPGFQIVLKKEDVDHIAPEIVYLPDLYVYCHHTSISNKNLLGEIQDAKDFCQKNNMAVTGRMMGIISYTTFHYPDQQFNYHVGIAVDPSCKEKFPDDMDHIPAGRYACFTTDESCMNIREVVMLFKIGWLDKSIYTWRELALYEEFLPENKISDYPFLKRKVYVQVKKR